MEPHKIVDVVQEIRKHSWYADFDEMTKAEINVASGAYDVYSPRSSYNVREDNRYLREVWRFLYADGKFPQ